MGNDPNDPNVIYNGQVMPLSQAKALQQQQIQTYENQMTVTMESLYSLSDSLGGTSGEVWNAKWQLDSDMAGIDSAIGTDDTGNKIRDSWRKNYPQLLAGHDSLGSSVDDLSSSLSTAGDQLYQTECANLKGFGITPTNPRPTPATGRGPRPF